MVGSAFGSFSSCILGRWGNPFVGGVGRRPQGSPLKLHLTQQNLHHYCNRPHLRRSFLQGAIMLLNGEARARSEVWRVVVEVELIRVRLMVKLGLSPRSNGKLLERSRSRSA
jgi:hypothetical protein